MRAQKVKVFSLKKKKIIMVKYNFPNFMPNKLKIRRCIYDEDTHSHGIVVQEGRTFVEPAYTWVLVPIWASVPHIPEPFQIASESGVGILGGTSRQTNFHFLTLKGKP